MSQRRSAPRKVESFQTRTVLLFCGCRTHRARIVTEGGETYRVNEGKEYVSMVERVFYCCTCRLLDKCFMCNRCIQCCTCGAAVTER